MTSFTRSLLFAAALIIVLLVLPITLLRGGVSRDDALENAQTLARVVQALATATNIKIQIMTYYAERGVLPDHLYELGIDNVDATKIQRRHGISLVKDGVIEILVRNASDEALGKLWMRPADHSPIGDIEWECVTGDFKNLGRYGPQCRYDASLATP